MKLAVRCSDNRCHHVVLDDGSSVAELKQAISQAEGIPPEQQVLVFAGLELQDEALLSEDLHLEDYSLQDEVVLHIKSKLADPVMVHLTSPGARSVRISEVVESGSPLQGIQQLLQQHGQASTGFVTGAGCVIVKRGDGSTYTKLRVNERDTLGWLLDQLQAIEGKPPARLMFMQAPDGCLQCLHTLC